MIRFSSVLLLLATACAPASPSSSEARPTAAVRAGAAVGEDFKEGRVTSVRPDVVKVSFEIEVSPAQAWEVLGPVVAELGVEITETDPAALSLSNPEFAFSRRLGDEQPSRYLRCGSGMTGQFADQYRIRMNFFTQVTSGSEGKSVVETTIQAMATNPRGTSNARVLCTSTHILESRIAEGVAKRVGG